MNPVVDAMALVLEVVLVLVMGVDPDAVQDAAVAVKVPVHPGAEVDVLGVVKVLVLVPVVLGALPHAVNSAMRAVDTDVTRSVMVV